MYARPDWAAAKSPRGSCMVGAGLFCIRHDDQPSQRALTSPHTRGRLHAEPQDITLLVPVWRRESGAVYRPGRLAALALLVALVSACAAAPTTPEGSPMAKLEKADGTVRVVLVQTAVE